MISSPSRLLRLALAAGVAALAAGCTSTRSAEPVRVVLVHGAWSDATAWDRVAADLDARGFSVATVNLPGHGADETPAEQLSLSAYADAVVAALPASGKALLVGHSMGGMVISQVAERVPERIAKLVYVAAYLPQDGQSLYQISMTDKDSKVGRYWRQDDPQKYTPATIAREGIVEVFCADCSAEDRRMLVDRHKAEAVAPLGTPVRLTPTRFGSVPRAYVHTTQDNAVSYALQRSMLAAAGTADPVVTLQASHMPMLSQPKAVADAIAGAAR
ncbi:MAG: alpha/beta fold hydrolase [Lautropia sp.]